MVYKSRRFSIIVQENTAFNIQNFQVEHPEFKTAQILSQNFLNTNSYTQKLYFFLPHTHTHPKITTTMKLATFMKELMEILKKIPDAERAE